MSNAIAMPQPSPLVRLVADNVRMECARLDWQQADVARLLGTSRTAVNNRWRGRMQWQLEDLEKLASAMAIPVDQLLRARRDSNPQPSDLYSVGSDLTGADPEAIAPVIDIATRQRVA